MCSRGINDSKTRKRILLFVGMPVAVVLTVVFACNVMVSCNASGRTYDDVNEIPHNRYGLLLGTSPFTANGARNFYFENRIKAAEQLYKAGKVNILIVSGGDYTRVHETGYDEPMAMRDSLMAHGVPEDSIILDYGGTRTILSIVKAKKEYHLDSVTIISQEDHNKRAIYIADHIGLHAIGYNAAPSHIFRNRLKNTIREYFARVKMFIDILNLK